MVPCFSMKLLRSFQKSLICPRVRGLAVVKGTPTPQNIRPYLITHGQYINFVLLPVFALQKKSSSSSPTQQSQQSHRNRGNESNTNTVTSTHNTFYCTLVSNMSVHICGRFVFPPYVQMKSVDQHTFTKLHNKHILIQSFLRGCTKHLGLNSCNSFYFNTETLNNCYE